MPASVVLRLALNERDRRSFTKNGVFGAKTKAKLPVRRVRNSVGRQAG
jgi:hypothetical protein